METGDEPLAVAAAHRLGLVRTDRWPLVAAHLLAANYDGESLVTLAGLPQTAGGWEVDQLLGGLLTDLHAPELSDEEVGEVAAKLLAQGLPHYDFAVIRALAPLAPALDYPTGPIGTAYRLEEWLDCDCHANSVERQEATDVEAALERLPVLRMSAALAQALVCRE